MLSLINVTDNVKFDNCCTDNFKFDNCYWQC